MPRMIDHPVAFAVPFIIVIAGLYPLFTDLRDGKAGNLFIQHAVFNLCNHPAQQVFIKIRQRITLQDILQPNLSDHGGRLQFYGNFLGKRIIESLALIVIHQVLNEYDCIILSGGEERFPSFRNIPASDGIHIGHDHRTKELRYGRCRILISQILLAEIPEDPIKSLTFHSLQDDIILCPCKDSLFQKFIKAQRLHPSKDAKHAKMQPFLRNILNGKLPEFIDITAGPEFSEALNLVLALRRNSEFSHDLHQFIGVKMQ